MPLAISVPYQSIAWREDFGLLTWVEADTVLFSIVDVRGNTTSSKESLGNGMLSYAATCNTCELFSVLVATDENITVSQVNSNGKRLMSSVISTDHPSYLTSLMLPTQDTVLVWSARSSSDSSLEIFACVIGQSGPKRNCNFVVNSFSQGDQIHPSLAIIPTGLLVVWESIEFNTGIFAQRLNFDGSKIGTEYSLLENSGLHDPTLTQDLILFLSMSSGLVPKVTTGFQVMTSQAKTTGNFIPIWTLIETEPQFASVSSVSVGQNSVFILHSYFNADSQGEINIKEVTLGGCMLANYDSRSNNQESHIHGQLLTGSSSSLTYLFFDAVQLKHIIRTLSVPDPSVCGLHPSAWFPEWRKPVVPVQTVWKQVLILSAIGVGSIIGAVIVIVLLRLIITRVCKKRNEPDLSPNLDDSSIAKDESNLTIFGLKTPDSPLSPMSQKVTSPVSVDSPKKLPSTSPDHLLHKSPLTLSDQTPISAESEKPASYIHSYFS